MINEDFHNENETHVNNQYFIDVWKRNILFNDDKIRLTNCFWFTFMPPNSYMYYGLGISYAIVMILGCPANVLAIFCILKLKSLKSANILMINLAISDFILLANTIVVIYNSYYQGPALGNLGCQINGFVDSLARTVSTVTIAAIWCDRYNPIIHPLKSLAKHTKRRTRIWIGVIWIYGLLFSIVPLDFDYGFTPTDFLINCTFDFLSDDIIDKWKMIFYIIGAWIFPSIIILYCYIKISLAVYANSEATDSRIGQSSSKKMKKLIFGMLTTCTILFYTVSFAPHTIIAILLVLKKKEFITPIIMALTSLSNKICSCLNPFIYIIIGIKNSREH